MFRYISQQRQIIRSYYSRIGKTAVIYPTSFLVQVGMGQVGLGLIFFTRDVFRASPTQIGWLAGMWGISYVFGCLVVRPAFSRILPRYLIVGSNLCMFVLTLSMRYAPTLRWIFMLYVLYGVVVSLFWPPLMGWLSTDTEGTALGRVLSRFNLSWCIGGIVSPFICGWLSEQAVHLPLLLGSGTFLLVTVFVTGAVLVLPKVQEDNNTRVTSQTRLHSDRDYYEVLPSDYSRTNANTEQASLEQSTLLRYPAWVGLFATFFGQGLIWVIFPIAAPEELSMTKSVVGLLLLVSSLFNAIGFVILGKTAFWHFHSLPMLVGQLLSVAVFVSMAYARSTYPIGLLFALWGMSIALSYSNSIFHGVSGSLDRMQRMAIHEAILTLGIVAGSTIGGMVYQVHPMAHVYWVCALILLAATLVQLLLCTWTYMQNSRERWSDKKTE